MLPYFQRHSDVNNPEAYSNHETAATRSLARKLAARRAQGQSAKRACNAVCASIVISAVITLGVWLTRIWVS